MVRQLMSLKARIVWNTIRRQTWVLVMTILGLLYGLSMLAGITVGVVFSILDGHVEVTQSMLTLVGGILVLGWWIIPMTFSGMDNSLDPQRFAPYVGPSKRLALAMAVATGVGVGGIVTALVMLLPVLGWALNGQWLAAIVSFILIPLALLTAFTWARALTTWMGIRLQATSTRRDLSAAVSSLIFIVVVAPTGLWLNWLTRHFDPSFVSLTQTVVSWTPFGAVFGVSAALAHGNILVALARLAIAVVTVVAGMWLWRRALSSVMGGVAQPVSDEAKEAIAQGRYLIDPSADTAPEPRGRGRAASSLIPASLPRVERWQSVGLSAPTASLAARTARYWLRDARLLVNAGTIVFFFAFALMWSHLMPADAGPDMGWFFIFLMTILVGTSVGSLAQYDSTALWILVSSPITGRQERRGRFVGSLPLMLGLLILGTVVFSVFKGLSVSESAMLLTLMCGIFVSSSIVTFIVCARWVYPVQPPGTSPMSARGTGSMMSTMVIQLGTMLAAGVVCLPVIVSYVLGTVGIIPAWAVVLIGLVWTVLVAHFGLLWAGKVWDRHSADVLTTIRSWPGH
ncbi:hypothetical protein G7Y41_04445 [Schaalia sp. ZJ405]|uniref:hypothetical protein n=1 Tax=Schaalia sp. ZJ405 TaxID=2709403 RepID=UPI0013EAC018|nr:hypothetical protein [Schaalia sp. ZJ405]QPK82049.1 hypothetical protein G7Y41_04445 [Schaalia sp. ZJ405]